jgi:phage N-6-adenine-methyltransferase|tara:strand:+ start:773 stop:1282 length:510 start_codon:yes stop_codon:yes gene_type:complete
MGNPNWATPPEFFERCSRAFGPFDLDAAATADNKKCRMYLGPGSPLSEDALAGNWPGVGAVWLNPPYVKLRGRPGWQLAWRFEWVGVAESESANMARTVCMLLPNDTDTRWFHFLFEVAEIYVTRGRIKFIDPEGGGRCSPRQGHIVAVLRPPVQGLVRPTGIVGTIDA